MEINDGLETKSIDNFFILKGGIQNYNNYKGIKLISHIIKVWKRMVRLRIRNGHVYFCELFRFMRRHSTT